MGERAHLGLMPSWLFEHTPLQQSVSALQFSLDHLHRVLSVSEIISICYNHCVVKLLDSFCTKLNNDEGSILTLKLPGFYAVSVGLDFHSLI